MRISIFSSNDELLSRYDECAAINLICGDHQVFTMDILKNIPEEQHNEVLQMAIGTADYRFFIYNPENPDDCLFDKILEILANPLNNRQDQYSLVIPEGAVSKYSNGQELFFAKDEKPFVVGYQIASYIEAM